MPTSQSGDMEAAAKGSRKVRPLDLHQLRGIRKRSSSIGKQAGKA